MKKIIAIILIILLWVSFNLEIFYIKSNSMNPYFYAGDLVVTKASLKYRNQDVVTFQINPTTYVTHRIIRIHTGMLFETKGDANNTKDAWPIKEKEIVGKVLFVIPTHKIINLDNLERG